MYPLATATYIALCEVRRQRPPPLGEYAFPEDPMRTRLAKPPPSLCKHCGSPHHWDRECRHHVTAMSAEMQEQEYVEAYHSAVEYISSDYVDVTLLKFTRISETDHGDPSFVDDQSAIASANVTERQPRPRATVKEVEDEENTGPRHVLVGGPPGTLLEEILSANDAGPASFENEGEAYAAERGALDAEATSGDPRRTGDQEGIGAAVEPPLPGHGGQRHEPSSGWNREEENLPAQRQSRAWSPSS
ncbi:hypothetical protein B0H16DRAFT_1469489 [Mycena metata]|uniref:CCHC-type domain-containing protein n=1 Tax=Mycena metata TaxID=1033252 RepID=A0AAD7MT34_9AGAR|nr:hypothetical protein B0H16DRAFT_1469489 [Mycena metata]